MSSTHQQAGSTRLRVGFIGLGDQGLPMAEAIAEAGHELHVWSRRAESSAPLAGRAVIHDDLGTLAASIDHLGVCLGNADDLQEVLVDGGVFARLAPGSVVAVHSTVAPEVVQDLAQALGGLGGSLVDAPVSGGREGARARRLLVMAGAETATFEQARPVFESYASTICHLGPVGMGQTAKLLNNLLMNINFAGAELVLELGRVLGIPRADLRDALTAGTSASYILERLDTSIVASQLPMVNARKDLAAARALIAGAPLETPLLARLADVAAQARESFAGASSRAGPFPKNNCKPI